MRNCKDFDLDRNSLSTVDPKNVAELRRRYDVSLEDAESVIDLLGYKNALSYTNWFFNSSLNNQCYLPGAKKVADGFVKLSELNVSLIETIVKDSIKTFGITTRQLNQTGYLRANDLTGKKVSGDNPYNSGHLIEHGLSRMDRLED